ncbi:MAG: hypothetical protein AAB295_04615 [Chloroflexota bacterium]|mgnify:CR=1 FL=1
MIPSELIRCALGLAEPAAGACGCLDHCTEDAADVCACHCHIGQPLTAQQRAAAALRLAGGHHGGCRHRALAMVLLHGCEAPTRAEAR